MFKINKMEFLYLIPDVRKHIFKKAIIKAAFLKTSLYLFNLRRCLINYLYYLRLY
jgi:hypothetical protein